MPYLWPLTLIDLRRLVVLALTVVWGMRLGLYIGFRNRGHGQDKRYTALLKHQQGPLIPFLIRKIYGLQGVLILVVSLPVQFAMYEFRALGVLGAIDRWRFSPRVPVA